MQPIKMLGFCIFLFCAASILNSCQTDGGVSYEESTWDNTITVDGQVADLTIDATKKLLGNAVIRITVTNTSQQNLQPALGKDKVCYRFTVLNDDNKAVKTITFGLSDFRKNFDSDMLLPRNAYTNFDYVTSKDLFNLTGGKVRAEVWLSKADEAGKIYHIWSEIQLKDIFEKISSKANRLQ